MTDPVTPSEPREQLQAALAGRYVVERELGRGGMATVYLARDLRHERLVALKVLRSDFGAALGPERFAREIKLAAGLQHPHIVSVYDSGSTPGGQLWFTMPYVEGESLRARLRHQRQLSLDEALRITREVALALDYAHRHGVLHRDIKPENILLVDGQAMVADFGVARTLAGSKPGDTLTQPGMAIGTPAYMSPEQAAGEHAVERASDVYSLGVVLYEMLAGEPPYTGPTAQAIAAKMMAGEPPSVRRARSSVPPAVDQAIHKALSPVPADRYATGAEFARALETGQTAAIASAYSEHQGRRRMLGISLASVVVVLLLFAATYARYSLGRGTATGARTPTSPPLLAVLPFESAGDTTGREFADGMSEEITTRLARVGGMNVIARTSAMQYRSSGQSAPVFGRRLGVDYVLDGTVRWAAARDGAKRVRITPALIRVRDGTEVWGEPYEGVPADVFQLQSDVAEHVATALRLTLLPAERAVVRTAPTQDLEAYRLYLVGREEWRKRTVIGLQHAVADFEQAIARDPKYARAYAGLADAYGLYWFWGVRTLPRDTAYARAKAAARQALALDSTLAEAHAALGEIADLADWDREGSARELQRAIALDPNYATAHQWYAEYLKEIGRADEAVVEAARAVELDPLAPATSFTYGRALLAAGHVDQAIEVYRAAMARDSVSARLVRDNLRWAYLTAGRTEDALALMHATGDTSEFDRDLALARVDAGARRRVIAGWQRESPMDRLQSLALLGERDSAFAALDRAIAAHEEEVPWLKTNPVYSSLRSDPRYVTALRRMGLPP